MKNNKKKKTQRIVLEAMLKKAINTRINLEPDIYELEERRIRINNQNSLTPLIVGLISYFIMLALNPIDYSIIFGLSVIIMILVKIYFEI